MRAVFPHLEGAGGASAQFSHRRRSQSGSERVSSHAHSAGASLGSASGGPTIPGGALRSIKAAHGSMAILMFDRKAPILPSPPGLRQASARRGGQARPQASAPAARARPNRARWRSRSSREHYLDCCPKPLPSVAEQFDQLVLLDQQRPCCGDHLNAITAARIREDLQLAGLDWITSLRAPQYQTLAERGPLQLSLFDERNLAEITAPDYPGERLIVCRNPTWRKSAPGSATSCWPQPSAISRASSPMSAGATRRCAARPRSV